MRLKQATLAWSKLSASAALHLITYQFYGGKSLIHIMAESCHSEEVLGAVLTAAGWMVNTVDALGCTPLMRAAMNDNLVAAKILLMFGADPDIRGPFGCTALHLANTEVSNELKKFGAVAVPDVDGVMPPVRG